MLAVAEEPRGGINNFRFDVRYLREARYADDVLRTARTEVVETGER